MKKAKTYLFNSLAGMLFIVLLAVNVQIGSSNSLIGNTSIDEAEAAFCDPVLIFCTIDIWGNIIWGHYEEGIPDEK